MYHKVWFSCIFGLVLTLYGYDDYDSQEYEAPITEHTIVSHKNKVRNEDNYEEPISDTAKVPQHEREAKEESYKQQEDTNKLIESDFYDDRDMESDDTLDLLYGDTTSSNTEDFYDKPKKLSHHREMISDDEPIEFPSEEIDKSTSRDSDEVLDDNDESDVFGSLFHKHKKEETKQKEKLSMDPQPVEVDDYNDIYDIEEPVDETTKNVSTTDNSHMIEPQDIEYEEASQTVDSSYEEPKKHIRSQETFLEKKVFKDKREVDTDEDGINDMQDMCPQTPLGATVDENGCPLDSDGDGVYDYKDVCKNTPLRAKVDKNGCEIKKVAKKMLKVTFKPKSTRLTYNSFSEILRFSDFLKKYPRYDTQIIAYAVNDRALDLAKKRANAIKEALIIEGIDASRIETSAYSQNRKNADNLLDKTPIEVRIFY